MTDYRTALKLAGRNDAPRVLWEWWRSGSLDDDQLAYRVSETWRGAEFPELVLGRRPWLILFRAGGYFSDAGEDAPTEALRLYRAAPPRYARGMSWTRDRDRARWFAERWGLTGRPAFVYLVDAPPPAVLASIYLRGEQEVIVDPSMVGKLSRS
jgi:hypothetical protein